jgi:hypothetical protein
MGGPQSDLDIDSIEAHRMIVDLGFELDQPAPI